MGRRDLTTLAPISKKRYTAANFASDVLLAAAAVCAILSFLAMIGSI